jgi:hypothetical protein
MASFLLREAPRAFHAFRATAPRPVQFPQKPAASLFRRYLATPAAEQPRLRLGSTGGTLRRKDKWETG